MKNKLNNLLVCILMIASLQLTLFASNNEVISNLGQVETSECMSVVKNIRARMSPDIVEIASQDERFSTLVAALEAAGLVEALKAEGPFTVFAPTNDAFAKLPAGTVDELLKPENKETLTNILTYHVIPGKVLAKDAIKLDGQEVMMLNGEQVKVIVKDDKVYINDAEVIVTDIIGKNGVIHVIDTVIMPPK